MLYNVQSVGRAQGIYRILNIMLASKSPQTLFGVVRNAYRPGQEVSIHHLEDLPSLQFDMLTTIVIGNRFTQRKRSFIFTPRGYKAEVVAQHCPGVSVWAGQQGVEARKQALQRYQARGLIDGTHPYASLILEQLMGLSQRLGMPYLRYERTSSFSADSGQLCGSIIDAAEQAIAKGRHIFLATGSKELAIFLKVPGAKEREWFIRVTPEPKFIQRAIDLGVPHSHICAMQRPFSQAFNEALWRDWAINCVVTKDSGDVGGYQAKVAATQSLNIPLLVSKRPKLSYPLATSFFDDVLKHAQNPDQAIKRGNTRARHSYPHGHQPL